MPGMRERGAHVYVRLGDGRADKKAGEEKVKYKRSGSEGRDVFCPHVFECERAPD